jgi:hypothetical protein
MYLFTGHSTIGITGLSNGAQAPVEAKLVANVRLAQRRRRGAKLKIQT